MLMRTISEVTKGNSLSMEALGLYFKMLQRFEFEAISRVIFGLIERNKFTPAISEIIQEIEGKPEERSSIAWAKVIKTLSDVGTYKSVQFDDPAIHYAITRMGGWIQLGQTHEDQMRFVARDFERYYQESSHLRLTWGDREVPSVMFGITDAHAVREGFELAEPVRPHELQASVMPQIEPPKPQRGNLIPFNPDLSMIGKAVK